MPLVSYVQLFTHHFLQLKSHQLVNWDETSKELRDLPVPKGYCIQFWYRWACWPEYISFQLGFIEYYRKCFCKKKKLNNKKNILGISGNDYPSYLLKHQVTLIAFLSFCIMTLASRGMPLGVTDTWSPPQGCASGLQTSSEHSFIAYVYTNPASLHIR